MMVQANDPGDNVYSVYICGMWYMNAEYIWALLCPSLWQFITIFRNSVLSRIPLPPLLPTAHTWGQRSLSIPGACLGIPDEKVGQGEVGTPRWSHGVHMTACSGEGQRWRVWDWCWGRGRKRRARLPSCQTAHKEPFKDTIIMIIIIVISH